MHLRGRRQIPSHAVKLWGCQMASFAQANQEWPREQAWCTDQREHLCHIHPLPGPPGKASSIRT